LPRPAEAKNQNVTTAEVANSVTENFWCKNSGSHLQHSFDIHNVNIHDAQSQPPLPHLHGKQWTFCIGECAHDETNAIFSSPQQPLCTTTAEPVPLLRHSCLKNKNTQSSQCGSIMLQTRLFDPQLVAEPLFDCCIQPGMAAL
jgi:hypothetical protein